MSDRHGLPDGLNYGHARRKPAARLTRKLIIDLHWEMSAPCEHLFAFSSLFPIVSSSLSPSSSAGIALNGENAPLAHSLTDCLMSLAATVFLSSRFGRSHKSKLENVLPLMTFRNFTANSCRVSRCSRCSCFVVFSLNERSAPLFLGKSRGKS
jgi:hypothetical protein